MYTGKYTDTEVSEGERLTKAPQVMINDKTKVGIWLPMTTPV